MANADVTRSLSKGEKDYYTPELAFNYILPILEKYFPDKNLVIWEPCLGEGHIMAYLQKNGWRNVIGTDIKTGHDVLKWTPDTHYDLIVTNPPFYRKRIFIERFIEIGKPAFLLLPSITLTESNTIRQIYKTMFERDMMGIFMPPKMIHYIPKEYAERQKRGEDVDCQRLTTRQSRTFFHSTWFAFHDQRLAGLHFL